eukprot:12183114-Ditylum_brightwellii.AAC.1
MMEFKGNMLCPWANFFDSAIAIHDWLSSNTLQWTVGVGMYKVKISASSSIRNIKGIASLIAVDRAMYSASAVIKAISVCSLIDQITGHPA